MWWSGQQDTPLKAADYRSDFAALVQWLHARRGMEHPLRHGGFRPIMQDEERRLFAFARTLSGDEVVLVVNYGHTKHKVVLQAGTPGQLAGVLSPQFGRLTSGKQRSGRSKADSTQAHIQSLWVGGSRKYVDTGGHIRLWVTPMSVRVVLLHGT
jgi:hypothetical protein